MKANELKTIVSKHLIRLMGEWFNDNPFFQAIGKTVVQANINKFDGLLEMLSDTNGDIMTNALIENLGDIVEKGYQIDLTEISPLLPNRILLVTKEDVKSLISEINKGG